MSKTISQRFWEKVAVGGPDECWPWQASKDSIGYGRFGISGKCRKANRVALMLRGIIEPFDGACAMHKCDNRACCNPAHLSWGTQSENMTDCSRRGRNKMSRLTPEAVREIRASKLTQYQLADAYGVTQGAIYCILAGKTWRHVL
jgi:hypothetical protein